MQKRFTEYWYVAGMREGVGGSKFQNHLSLTPFYIGLQVSEISAFDEKHTNHIT